LSPNLWNVSRTWSLFKIGFCNLLTWFSNAENASNLFFLIKAAMKLSGEMAVIAKGLNSVSGKS
jgi:hypothetical protein